jgi:hypothetical protein
MEQSINVKIQFVTYKKEGDLVKYQIRVTSQNDASLNAELYERYSSLHTLHEALKKEANNPSNFPKFPPKKFFGSTDEKFLNQRQIGLQHYFNAISGTKEFANLPSFKKFIDNIFKTYGSKKENISNINKNTDNRQDGNTNINIKNRTNSNSGQVNTLANNQSFSKNIGNINQFI